MIKRIVLSVFCAVAAASGLLAVSCSVESADSVSRSVNANVAGVYRNGNDNEQGGAFVSRQSGRKVDFLNLRQGGDQLEANDNNNIVFRGTIGNVSENAVSFNLEGATTAGNRVLISGSIEIGGGEGVMRATWIEDNLFGNVYGVANGPTINTNVPPPATNGNGSATSPLTITSSTGSFTVNSNGAETTLTAGGGTPPYSWVVSSQARGTLSANSGASVVYRRISAGENSVTLTDNVGSNRVQNIIQP